MRVLPRLALLISAGLLSAQDSVYVCPMDPDVRSSTPGVCSRCGMKLLSGIPDPVEYPVDLRVSPRALRPHEATRLEFVVRNPWNHRVVTSFRPVHEKLFHLFLVSRDLKYFVHDHPSLGEDGTFRFDLAFPSPGLYRVLCDFYPDGGMPQLVSKTIIVPGLAPKSVAFGRDYTTKDASNLHVELVTVPPQPIAGTKTILFFRVTPADGLEQHLGAWGHMLAASDDLIDLIHNHPFLADGGPEVQFNMIFPRTRTYRIWVQLQRKGVVNTAHFDVPVSALE